MLKRLGWQPGEPLGKRGEGIIEPIATSPPRAHRAGLGTRSENRRSQSKRAACREWLGFVDESMSQSVMASRFFALNKQLSERAIGLNSIELQWVPMIALRL